jgi:hypothetical protein
LQKALDQYNFPATEFVAPNLFDFNRSLFSDSSIRIRLWQLFHNRSTQAEQDAWYRLAERSTINAKHGVEYPDESFSANVDDAAVEDIPIETRLMVAQYLADRVTPAGLIRLLGWLDDPVYIPWLQRALTQPSRYDVAMVKLSLARLNVMNYQEEVIEHSSFSVVKELKLTPHENVSRYREASRALLFICSQQSVLELSGWLKMSADAARYKGDYVLPSETMLVLNDLRSIIMNSDFQALFHDDWTPLKKNHLETVEKWITEKFGHYQLKR